MPVDKNYQSTEMNMSNNTGKIPTLVAHIKAAKYGVCLLNKILWKRYWAKNFLLTISALCSLCICCGKSYSVVKSFFV